MHLDYNFIINNNNIDIDLIDISITTKNERMKFIANSIYNNIITNKYNLIIFELFKKVILYKDESGENLIEYGYWCFDNIIDYEYVFENDNYESVYNEYILQNSDEGFYDDFDL